MFLDVKGNPIFKVPCQKLSIFNSVLEKYHKMPHKIPRSRNINQYRTIVLNVPHFSEIFKKNKKIKIIFLYPLWTKN